jgi:hypothetical protein
VVGSQHPCADVRVVSPGGLKLVETRAVVEGGSDLWSRPPLGGEVESMEAMKRLAREFLAKLRAEVDRVIFFGLGLKLKKTMGIRRKMARVFSRLGLKPKMLLGFNGRRRNSFRVRPRPVVAASRVKYNAVSEASSQAGIPPPAKSEASAAGSEAESSCLAFSGDAGGDKGIPGSVSGKGVSEPRAGTLSPTKGLSDVKASTPSKGLVLRCSDDVAGLGPAVGPVAEFSASPIGKFADRVPSRANSLLWRGFLLRRRSDLANISGGNEQMLLVLELEPVLVPDPVLDPASFINPNPILDPDPDLALILNPSEPRISGEGGSDLGSGTMWRSFRCAEEGF